MVRFVGARSLPALVWVFALVASVSIGILGYADATTTEVTCSPATVLVNDPTVVLVTVTDAGGAHNPSGDVSLSSSGSGSFGDLSPTLAPSGGGVSTCSTSYTPTSAAADTEIHTIGASYPGDGTSGASNGSFNLAAVNKRPCNVSLVLSKSSAFANETVTITVTVRDASSADPVNVPSGTVTFTSSNAGNFSATSRSLVNGSCTVNYTPTDPCSLSHNLEAAYGGSSVHLTARGTASLTIKKRQTQVAITTSGSGPYTLEATVSDSSDGTKVTPQGTIDWAYQGGTPATGHVSPATSTVDGSGKATTTYYVDDSTAFLHAVTATYTPSGCTHAGSANYVTIQKTPPSGICWDAGLAILIVNNVVFALNLASDIVAVIPDFDFGDPIAFSLKAVAYGLSFDLDFDGIPAFMEGIMGLSVISGDTDGDGLGDGEEVDLANGQYSADAPLPCSCPNPKFADSDGDGLSDGDELYLYQTQMCNPDTDGDGVSDGDEVATWSFPDARDHANPLEADTDGDGLPDALEINQGCNGGADGYVNCADSDGDGLPDGMDTAANLVSASLKVGTKYAGTPGHTPYQTVMLGSGDGEELVSDSLSSIADPDSDGDGLKDGVEVQMGLNPLDWDTDNDGRSDGGEVLGTGPIPTDPFDPDTDDDGLLDSAELFGANPTNPVMADTDGDGLCDGGGVSRTPSHTGTCALCTAGTGGHPNPQGLGEDEDGDGSWDALAETNPNQPDTDGDAVGDGIEKLGFSTLRQWMIPAADELGRGITVTYPACGCMNPLNPDTDGDGLLDGYEDQNHDGNFDFLRSDFDWAASPLLGPAMPQPKETNPCDRDTDHDGLNDYQERFQPNPGSAYPFNPTNPLDMDSDNDWMLDGAEVSYVCVPIQYIPIDSDADGRFDEDPIDGVDNDADGLIDEDPVDFTIHSVAMLNPTDRDSDSDGLIDGLDPDPCNSVLIPAVNPPQDLTRDTDQDGFSDFDEFIAGTNPNDPQDRPAAFAKVDLDLDQSADDQTWLEHRAGAATATSVAIDLDSNGLVDLRLPLRNVQNVRRGDFDGDGQTDDVRYTAEYALSSNLLPHVAMTIDDYNGDFVIDRVTAASK